VEFTELLVRTNNQEQGRVRDEQHSEVGGVTCAMNVAVWALTLGRPRLRSVDESYLHLESQGVDARSPCFVAVDRERR